MIFYKWITFFAFFISSLTWASSTTAQNTGMQEWSDDASWSNGSPGCFDSIIIPSGVYIEVDIMVNLTGCSNTLVFVSGELHFITGKKLELSCDSEIRISAGGSITAGGGGGSSNLIEICNNVVWTAGDGDITTPTTVCFGCDPLAVFLYSSSCYVIDRHVNLDWITYYEEQNDFFLISYNSELDQNWKEIGFVDGNGTTSQSINYSFAHYPTEFGTLFYKLEQVDFNGTRSLLGIYTIFFGSKDQVIGSYSLNGQMIPIDNPGLKIVLQEDGSRNLVYYLGE